MLNQTTTASQPQNMETLKVAFQKFNGVILAKISNLKDKETFAYGETQVLAEEKARINYQRKYYSNFATL